MSDTENRPHFAPFATMLGAVIIIFLLISQIGKRTLHLYLKEKTPVAVAKLDRGQASLESARRKALVTIGALPRPVAASAVRTAVNSQVKPLSAAAPQKTAPTAPVTPAPTVTVALSIPRPTAMTVENSPAPAAARYYKVRPGDTLYAIARKTYGNGNGWKKILKANRLSSPAAISAGQKLLIPDTEAHTACAR